jgi:hypothetical protein
LLRITLMDDGGQIDLSDEQLENDLSSNGQSLDPASKATYERVGHMWKWRNRFNWWRETTSCERGGHQIGLDLSNKNSIMLDLAINTETITWKWYSWAHEYLEILECHIEHFSKSIGIFQLIIKSWSKSPKMARNRFSWPMGKQLNSISSALVHGMQLSLILGREIRKSNSGVRLTLRFNHSITPKKIDFVKKLNALRSVLPKRADSGRQIQRRHPHACPDLRKSRRQLTKKNHCGRIGIRSTRHLPL